MIPSPYEEIFIRKNLAISVENSYNSGLLIIIL